MNWQTVAEIAEVLNTSLFYVRTEVEVKRKQSMGLPLTKVEKAVDDSLRESRLKTIHERRAQAVSECVDKLKELAKEELKLITLPPLEWPPRWRLPKGKPKEIKITEPKPPEDKPPGVKP